MNILSKTTSAIQTRAEKKRYIRPELIEINPNAATAGGKATTPGETVFSGPS